MRLSRSKEGECGEKHWVETSVVSGQGRSRSGEISSHIRRHFKVIDVLESVERKSEAALTLKREEMELIGS